MGTINFMYESSKDKTTEGLLVALESVLRIKENMDTQRLIYDDEHIIQARVKKGNSKKFLGLDKAIMIKVKTKENNIVVELGEAKWIDKGIALTVSMITLWPLAITSSIGIYKQKKLPETIKKITDSYMEQNGVFIDVEPTMLEKINENGTVNKVGTKLGPRIINEVSKIISRL